MSKLKVRPLHDRIIVKRLTEEEKTKGGIIIPDSAKEKPQEGEIVAVGPGRLDRDAEKRIPIDLKIGAKVLFESWAGKEYKAEGEEYKILREDEILGLIEK